MSHVALHPQVAYTALTPCWVEKDSGEKEGRTILQTAIAKTMNCRLLQSLHTKLARAIRLISQLLVKSLVDCHTQRFCKCIIHTSDYRGKTTPVEHLMQAMRLAEAALMACPLQNSGAMESPDSQSQHSASTGVSSHQYLVQHLCCATRFQSHQELYCALLTIHDDESKSLKRHTANP